MAYGFNWASWWEQIATPGAADYPGTGFNLIYPKSDGLWYTLNSAGAETLLGSGGASSHVSLTLTGTAGAGLANFLAQSSPAAIPAAPGFSLYGDADGDLSWRLNDGGTDTFVRTLAGALTANRTYLLPDVDGTLVLRETLDAPPTIGGTTPGLITGTSIVATVLNSVDRDASDAQYIASTYIGSGTAVTANTTRFIARRAQNTKASPAAVVSGDRVGTYEWEPHDGTAFVVAARMTSLVASAPATGIVPLKLLFQLQQAGSATLREVLGLSGTEVVVNEDSRDIDFRWESDTDAAAFVLDASTNRQGWFTATPSTDVGIGGNAARTVALERHSTANTAGSSLSLQSGGATSAATDKAAGALILKTGVNTGNSVPAVIQFRAGVVSPTAGTGDNALVDRLMLGASKVLTDASPITLLNATLAAGSLIGGVIFYTVEVQDGTDFQVETGAVFFSGYNKAGAFGVTVTELNSQQNLSAGTLTTVWAISSANPAAISINADTSLTPSAGFPRITYSVHNFAQQAIAAA